MRVNFLAGTLGKWGLVGGYGSLAQTIGEGLDKKGIEVFITTFKGNNQRRVEKINNMTILAYQQFKGFPFSGTISNIISPYETAKYSNSDIFYHIGEEYFSYLTMKATPKKKHFINFQDPRDEQDWNEIFSLGKFGYKFNPIKKYAQDRMREWAVKHADLLVCQAKYLIPKVKKLYGLDSDPEFLPNPIQIPEGKIIKSSNPTVLFVARLGPEKRVEIFCEVAKNFPQAEFHVLGDFNDKAQTLKKEYNLKNLFFHGYVFGDDKKRFFDKSWVVFNCSVHECLPITFLEGWSYKCAVLSNQNPDNLTERYGIFVGGPELFEIEMERFNRGLEKLLKNNSWKRKGLEGFAYVKSTHEYNKVIQKNLDILKSLK